MADGLEVVGLRQVEVLATQPVPQALAPDRPPKLTSLFAVEGQKLLHGRDAALIEALFGFGADSRQIAQRESPKCFRKKVEGQRDKAIWLLHVAGNLREEPIRCQPDGAS